ncbi:MAG: hypothetical protein ACTHJL_02535 [Amnibacterium sp.]
MGVRRGAAQGARSRVRRGGARAAALVSALLAVGALSACAEGLPGGIGAGHYTAVRVRGDAPALAAFGRHGIRIWFERENGRLTMVTDGPVSTWNVPVDIRGPAITPDPAHETVSAAGCAGATPICAADAWLGRFIAKPMRYTLRGTELVITADAAELDLRCA